MSKKEVARTIIFVLITIIVLGYLTCVFSFPTGKAGDGIKERFNSFYEQPEDTIDGIYIGASGVDRYWVGPQAYHDYGQTVFTLSSGSQPLVFVRYLIKETLKTQSPQIFIIDLRSVAKSPDDVTDAYIRRVTDNMKPSLNRIKATKAILEYSSKGDNKVDEEDLSYYINLMKYHSMWDGGITLGDLRNLNPSTDFMGYAAHTDVIYKSRTQKEPVITDEEIAIDRATEDVLTDLLDYCDELKSEFDFLFVASPYPENTQIQGNINYAMDIVEKRGYQTLNFNTQELYQDIGLNFKTDYYDSHHVNLVGALKYTDYFAKYLGHQYNLPDRRTDSKYTNWEQSYESYKAATKEGSALLNERIKKKLSN